MSLSLVVVAAFAATPGPLAVVKNADAEVQKVLQAGNPTVEALAKKADDFVDFFELAKRSLGKEWAKLNKKQQDEFSVTMKGLLRANYAHKAISDGRGNAAFAYGGEAITGNEATVETSLKVKSDVFPVKYTLARGDAKASWRIVDVITDGVSLVDTYRDQFRQVIAKKGFDGLLASLKTKRDQLEKTPVSVAAPTAAPKESLPPAGAVDQRPE
ncbi:MAG: ABC transporter substrate-binding protein [Archangium sp.]|nr:ABC transporter substrate-binding protein [Archangium sp.]